MKQTTCENINNELFDSFDPAQENLIGGNGTNHATVNAGSTGGRSDVSVDGQVDF